MTAGIKVVIAGYARSPFTLAAKGDLKDVRPDDLLAQTLRGLVEKTGVDATKIENVTVGCAFPEGEQGNNIARNAQLLSGLPLTGSAYTLNHYCGSSMQAIHAVAGNIAMGMMDAAIAAGVESMSRVPMGGFNPMPNPELFSKMPGTGANMLETAENVAKLYNVTRAEQDALALRSQFNAAAAIKEGKLKNEIVPIVKKNGTVVENDGIPRFDSSAEGLAKLKTVFTAEDSTVTAGNASPLTDGASAVLVCSEEFALKNGLEILAEVASYASTGCAPEIMGIGPVSSTQQALKKAGITMNDVSIVEINEAFGAQAVACLRELGIAEEKVNKHGGAIALGHPLGATGARITGKAAQLLHDDPNAEYAVSTQCIGGGQGIATVLKKYKPQTGARKTA